MQIIHILNSDPQFTLANPQEVSGFSLQVSDLRFQVSAFSLQLSK